MKKCPKCEITKDFTEFYKNKSSPDGYSYHCASCNKEENKLFRKNNPQKAKERDLRYRLKYAEEIKIKDAKRYERDVKKNMIRRAKHRAKELNLPFNITEKDFDVPELCPILKIPLILGVGKKYMQPDSPSLDRVIPEAGYVKGNIIVICAKANTMKNNATLEEIIAVGEYYKKLLEEAKKNE